ncbi:HAD family hydrolase, partial [Candidatus Micrarchaeota archaeon]|nr:HAD family hydrolase [Candidatus Micrarchaeota archaeon]
MHKVKYLIFDLDNTLFDYETSAREAMKEVYSKIAEKHPFKLNELEQAYTKLLKEIEEHFFTDGRKSTEYSKERFEKLLLEFNCKDEGLVGELLIVYEKHLIQHTRLFPDAIAALEKLSKEYRLILATQGPADAQHRAID